MTDTTAVQLDGAEGTVPDLLAVPSTPAEFAALWNVWSPTARSQYLARVEEWRADATRCRKENHDDTDRRSPDADRPPMPAPFILIAKDFEDAKAHDMRGVRSVVTLLSRNRARGVRAAELRITRAAMETPSTAIATLLEAVLPSVDGISGRPCIRLLIPETVHQAPIGADGLTPCCHRPPFELPGDRITTIHAFVTCGPTPTAYALAEGAEQEHS